MPDKVRASDDSGGAAATTDARRIVLVTGISGAGRSTALDILEDLGYEAIDNPPLEFLAAMAGALDLSLGPPDAWLNPAGRARAEAVDLRRARYLIAAAGLFLAAPLAALAAYFV